MRTRSVTSTCAHDDSATQYLEAATRSERCSWCGNDAIYRATLCSHCYGVRRGLANAEKKLSKLNPKDCGAFKIARLDLRVLEQKAELCKSDRILLRCILDGKVSGQDLEHRLREVSKRFVHSDLFDGMASLLGHAFSSSQRKYLSYLLWRLILADHRRTRRKKALKRAIIQS
jgi:hypothetical protein